MIKRPCLPFSESPFVTDARGGSLPVNVLNFNSTSLSIKFQSFIELSIIRIIRCCQWSISKSLQYYFSRRSEARLRVLCFLLTLALLDPLIPLPNLGFNLEFYLGKYNHLLRLLDPFPQKSLRQVIVKFLGPSECQWPLVTSSTTLVASVASQKRRRNIPFHFVWSL